MLDSVTLTSHLQVYEGDRPIDYHSHMSDVQFISLIFSQFLSMVAGLVGFLKKSSGLCQVVSLILFEVFSVCTETYNLCKLDGNMTTKYNT